MRILQISSSFLLVVFLTFSTKRYGTGATHYRFTNGTDQEALLAIKDHIQADPLRVLDSWNNFAHFCDWKGVACSPRHQRVTALNLSSLKLVGNLSPHLGNLTFLKVIDLSNNSFHGPIPCEIGRLYRLQSLFLANNSFQGKLPTNITSCSALVNLSLSRNKLEGPIPEKLGNLLKLVYLNLRNNGFSGTIPYSFGNLSSLTYLSLAYNNLHGSIPPELGQLSKLEYLQLGASHFTGMVPRTLYNLSSISLFVIAGNMLRGQIPLDICLTLPMAQTLFLGGNQFTGPIPTSLPNCSNLVQVDMSVNSLTGPVPLNLGALQHLERINLESKLLGDANATDDGLKFLTSLTNCTKLHAASFYQNQLRGKLPDSVANFSTKLGWLFMAENQIFGSIPYGISNLKNLELLSLSFNMLTGNIPDSIGELSKLQFLEFGVNKLSGRIPSNIGNATELRELELANNFLEGTIPLSLGNCSYLETLDLSANLLSGPIPKQVTGLSSLSIGLLLASNELTGSLPSELSNLRNLNLLDISQNKLVGAIPDALANCESLEILNMSGNSFEGPIPFSLRNLRGVRVLDLSRNNLSGTIPSFLGKLSLTWLNLSFNNFEGLVPMEGVFKNITAFSVHGNKGLCGGIPALQLQKCASNKGKHFPHKVRLLIIVIGAVLFLILLSVGLFIVRYRIKYSRKKLDGPLEMEERHVRLSYAELFEATQGFSSTNLIGQGRYGCVYKGILTNGDKTIAVKVLDLAKQGADKSFTAECEALRNFRHRNLVKVITSCSSINSQGDDFKALVFEFMPNGSLERWLHPSSTDEHNSRRLNLVQRLNIAVDVALALHYLHHECDSPVVHCDLKPSNILIDEDLTAHVSDFGLTKFLPMVKTNYTQGKSSSMGVRGTVGYIAPEYGMGGEVSIFGDVYSYGIFLMELLTGKSPTGNYMHMCNLSLRDFVEKALPDSVMTIVDNSVQSELNNAHRNGVNIERIMECLLSIFRVGIICSSTSPTDRRDMKYVLLQLHKIKNRLSSYGFT